MRCKARSVHTSVLALLVAWPLSVPAQATIATGSARAASSCIERLPPSVFTRVAVYAFVDLSEPVSSRFAASADNLLQEPVFAAHSLLGVAPATLPEGEPSITWHGVDSSLHLTAFPDGHIVSRDTTVGTAAALLARALSKDSTVGLLDWSADSARDSLRFDIALRRPTLDSAGHVSTPTFRRTAIPLLSVQAPWERQVSQKPGGTPPHYPEGARRTWYEATIVLKFIVDSTGRAVVSTITDVWLEGTPRLQGEKLRMYESFLESTKRAIPALEFTPAAIGGCPVNQLVRVPFMFHLRR